MALHLFLVEDSWSQICRYWFSSGLLNIWLQTDPVIIGGHGLLKPTQHDRIDPKVTKPDHLNTMAALENLFLKVINRIGDKGQPWRSPTLTGNESGILGDATACPWVPRPCVLTGRHIGGIESSCTQRSNLRKLWPGWLGTYTDILRRSLAYSFHQSTKSWVAGRCQTVQLLY